MLEAYTCALQEHVDETLEDLESIYQILQLREWTRVERKGAERLLQILVESCIGVSKHWLKQQKKMLPSDAYSVFEKLMDLQLIPPGEAGQWQRVVGMRNAIVHDYLNLDAKVIKAVVENKMYLKLHEYVLMVCGELKEVNNNE